MKRNKIIKKWQTIGFTILLSGITATSCQNKQESQITETDNVNYITTSINKEDSKSTLGCKIYADYPEKGSPFLLQNIREWINETLGGSYAGDLKNGKAVIEYYAQSINDRLKKDEAEFGSSPDMGGSVYYVQMRKAFETCLFVTYTNEIYQYYSGAAHGGQTYTGAVFRKTDGRKMGWDVFKQDSLNCINDMIKEQIKTQFFKIKDDKSFYDMLLIDNPELFFPLPKTDPLFMEKGVMFIYQQYEIAPYAAGRPSCTIPYERLKDYFTTTALPLAESHTDSIATKTKNGIIKLNVE